ncbi:MAG: STAS domain-containing protein [Planctomycetota bacterium]
MANSLHTTIPILKVRNCYLVTLTTELSDVDAIDLQERIMNRLWADPADAIIIDISALEIVDSFISRVFNDIGNSARTMGALAVIVGMNPAVAITLVEMDIEMNKVLITMDVDSAIELVEKKIKDKTAHRRKNTDGGGTLVAGRGGISAALARAVNKKRTDGGLAAALKSKRGSGADKTAAALNAIRNIKRGSVDRVRINRAK